MRSREKGSDGKVLEADLVIAGDDSQVQKSESRRTRLENHHYANTVVSRICRIKESCLYFGAKFPTSELVDVLCGAAGYELGELMSECDAFKSVLKFLIQNNDRSGRFAAMVFAVFAMIEKTAPSLPDPRDKVFEKTIVFKQFNAFSFAQMHLSATSQEMWRYHFN